MPRFRVVLIEPLNDGNVGAIARAMKNFGLEELVLVRPCAIGEEAIKRAMHATDILQKAERFFKEDDAFKGVDYVAATSGISTSNEKRFQRIAMAPKEFAEKVKDIDGTIALVFGREDFGLDKDLIRRADYLVTIPANPEYTVMNISHAAAVTFYELFASKVVSWEPKKAGETETEKLHERFSMLLDTIDYPQHKKTKTKVMFRRLIARSAPSTWEFHTLMGVLSDALRKCSDGKLPRKTKKKNGGRPSKLR